MDTAAKRFFTLPRFAVVGASQNPHKFGYKILAWYHAHRLPVTPINPGCKSIDFPSASYKTASSVTALSNAAETGLSFLTPPSVTMQVLSEAREAGVQAVWLQPGSFDEETMRYAKDNFESAIGGYDDGTVGGEGWCILVDGENSMDAAGRKIVRQKL